MRILFGSVCVCDIHMQVKIMYSVTGRSKSEMAMALACHLCQFFLFFKFIMLRIFCLNLV